MREWLLFNANSEFFSWREHVTFWWDVNDVCFVLDQHDELDFCSGCSLKQLSAGKYVTPIGNNILIPSQQSLLLLLSAACLVEKNKYQFDSLWLDPTRAQFTIYHTQGEHANHYTTDAVSRILEVAILDYKIFLLDQSFAGPSWSWLYGSWIYNCLCNQCLSPLKLWVWTPFMARCTQYNIMW